MHDIQLFYQKKFSVFDFRINRLLNDIEFLYLCNTHTNTCTNYFFWTNVIVQEKANKLFISKGNNQIKVI